MKIFLLSGLLPLATLTVLAADDPYAASLFQKNCSTCHMSSRAAARIPQLDVLKTLTPITILRTLETGAMKTQAAQLSTYERHGIGTVGGIQWGSATDGRNMYAALSDIEFRNTRINGGNDAVSEVDSTKGGGCSHCV
jgi:mono/diheme cytochrome c family protein